LSWNRRANGRRKPAGPGAPPAGLRRPLAILYQGRDAPGHKTLTDSGDRHLRRRNRGSGQGGDRSFYRCVTAAGSAAGRATRRAAAAPAAMAMVTTGCQSENREGKGYEQVAKAHGRRSSLPGMYGHMGGTHATVLEHRRTSGTIRGPGMAGGFTVRIRGIPPTKSSRWGGRKCPGDSPRRVCTAIAQKQNRAVGLGRFFAARVRKGTAGTTYSSRSDEAVNRNLNQSAVESVAVPPGRVEVSADPLPSNRWIGERDSTGLEACGDSSPAGIGVSGLHNWGKARPGRTRRPPELGQPVPRPLRRVHRNKVGHC
jgi:hypothetical protein